MLHKLTLKVLLASALLFLGGCDSPEEKQEKYIQRGDRYLEQQDYVHARLEYKNAAKINPTNVKVIYNLGLVEEAEGNIQLAFSAFMTAEQQDANFEPVVQKLAEFFLTAQQYDEAKIRIERLLMINPSNSMGHALNASLLLRQKNFTSADKEVKRALELDDKNVVAYSVLSGIYFSQKEPDEALAALDQGIQSKADEVSLYLLKAVIYADQNDLESVQKVYQKIFEMNPDKIGYRFDLAQILSTAKDKDAAEQILRSTVEQFPENEDAKRKLVALIEDQKGIQSAEMEIKSLLKKTPDQKALYLWLADLYIRNKQDDLAISALKNILESPGEEWVGLVANTSLARIKLSQGDIDFAKKIIETVLSKDVNNSEALLLRANLTLAQGDYEQALGDVRNVIRDYPDSAQAARLMTEILVVQGRLDLAIDSLIQYHNHVADDLGAQVRLAQLYAMKGDVKQAYDILSSITRSDPSYTVAWETLARLSIENKLFDDAEESISHLGDSSSQAATVLFLQGQLHAAKGEKDLALDSYMSILKQYPSSPLVEHALAGVLAISSSQDELANVEAALAGLSSDNPAVTSVLGAVQAQLGKTDDAISTLKLAISQKPRSQAPYLSVAEIYRDRKDMDQALTVLDRAETEIPFEIKASMMKAEILVAKGEPGAAIRIYKSLLDKNRGSQMSDAIANNLAQNIADYQGDDKDALERARLVAERFMNSDNPYFLDTLAWVYYKQGNYAAAEPLLDKARSLLKTPNKDIDAHYQALKNALSKQR